METTSRKPTLQKTPVYEVRLVPARRALRVAESTASNEELAARTLHAMLGLTDREHFAALFLNCQHRITGAHVIAIGGQQGIGNDRGAHSVSRCDQRLRGRDHCRTFCAREQNAPSVTAQVMWPHAASTRQIEPAPIDSPGT
jgi:hypothetical protein